MGDRTWIFGFVSRIGAEIFAKNGGGFCSGDWRGFCANLFSPIFPVPKKAMPNPRHPNHKILQSFLGPS